MSTNKKITVKGIDISYRRIDSEDFISLTDLAKYREDEYPSAVITAWMRSRNTVEFLGTWEKIYNSDFNSIEFDRIDKEAGRNAFIMTPTRWIQSTGRRPYV